VTAGAQRVVIVSGLLQAEDIEVATKAARAAMAQ
jgi:thiamine monophosphate synthase